MLTDKEIEEFLGYLQNVRKHSAATIKTYKTTLFEAAQFVETLEEESKTLYDVMAYRHKIASSSTKTVAKKISTLRSFFEYKKMLGEKIKVIGLTQIKTTKTLPKPIHTELITKALKLCESDEERLLTLMLYSLGLRISELESLKISDVGAEWVSVRGGKGGKDRMIPLLPMVSEALFGHIKASANKTFIFEDKEKPLSQNCLRYRIFKIFKRVGVNVTPHQLRHSFATDLINKGAKIVDVSELLGHKELATTQIYTKLNMNKKLFSYLQAHPMCKE